VAGWFIKAARYMQVDRALVHGTPSRVRCAFVSTNSVTQGEQVGVLWGWLLAQGMKIQFAHRTFKWSNDAKGVAAVHCVIIGFGTQEVQVKTIYEYPDITSGPVPLVVKNINPYLVDATDVALSKRSEPICRVSPMVNGSKPADGGHLILSEQERLELLSLEPQAEAWIRPFVGAEEFINNRKRFCIWLVDCQPESLRKMPQVLRRVQSVKEMRLASTDKQTQADALTPRLFQKIRQPASNFLLIPSVSSERRDFVPIGFMSPETIISNLVYAIPDATLFHFGVMSSTMHNAWMRATCGRLESRYRYSANIVYNNYPWPKLPEPHATTDATRPTPAQAASQKKRAAIEAAAQAVLDVRASFREASLADLYDPLAMPPALSKAHQQLDKAVDAAYAYKGQPDDASRVAFLFGLYEQITSQVAQFNESRTHRRKQ